MKKSLLYCTLVVLLCMVSCDGNSPVQPDTKTLAKDWVGDETEVKFNISGTLLTPLEFAAYIDEHPLIAKAIGEQYLPYIRALSDFQIDKFNVHSDYTYDLVAHTGKRDPKTMSGTWMEINDVLTLHADLTDVLGVKYEGDLEVVVDKLTRNNIELSGAIPVLNQDVSGIDAGAIFSFKGHVAD